MMLAVVERSWEVGQFFLKKILGDSFFGVWVAIVVLQGLVVIMVIAMVVVVVGMVVVGGIKVMIPIN